MVWFGGSMEPEVFSVGFVISLTVMLGYVHVPTASDHILINPLNLRLHRLSTFECSTAMMSVPDAWLSCTFSLLSTAQSNMR